jgi:hypothetical protein
VGSTYPIVDFKKKMLEMYKSSTEVVNVSYLFFSSLQDFVIQKVNYSCSKFFQIIRDMEVNGIILSGDCSNYRFGCPDRKSREWYFLGMSRQLVSVSGYTGHQATEP